MSQIRTIHAFDALLATAFPEVAAKVFPQAVKDSYDWLGPEFPSCAIGLTAHFRAHRHLTEGMPPNMYRFAPNANQCRGLVKLGLASTEFSVLLASCDRIEEKRFKLHARGRETMDREAMLPLDLEDLHVSIGGFFLLGQRVPGLPGLANDRVLTYLVWGELQDDRQTLIADRVELLSDDELPPHGMPMIPTDPVQPLAPIYSTRPDIQILDIDAD